MTDRLPVYFEAAAVITVLVSAGASPRTQGEGTDLGGDSGAARSDTQDGSSPEG